MGRQFALAFAMMATLLASRVAHAQSRPGAEPPPQATAKPPSPTPPPITPKAAPKVIPAPAPALLEPSGNGGAPPLRPLIDLQNAPPPPTNVVFLQYGLAFTAEVVSSAGPICDNVTVPCIIGPGGGIAVRAGWRGAGALYLGGAYELSKQDPNKLLRLAILQQARAEGRYYFVSGRESEPYLTAGVGVAGYGNEWSVDTWGPSGFGGVGVETQLTRRTVVGLALAYRLLYFQEFVDSTGAARNAGITQLVGLDLVLEQREPIYTERLPSPR